MRQVPIVDISDGPGAAADAIDAACRDAGFFYVVGHGVDASLLMRLDALAREFFALADEEKAEIGMAHGGRAWRGWFPVGGELTSGEPDMKEGIYFGAELGADHPLVAAGTPLHGTNLFPRRPSGLREAVLDYMDALTAVGQTVLTSLAVGLGHDAGFFARTLTADPLVLFRIFHYPASNDASWGVGEHTDYGLLTLLAQDALGGLQVRGTDGWVDAPPVPGSFVCNIGDMLERLSGGAYRSTPHRVRNVSGAGRLSFPFFLDPSWDAVVDDEGGTYGEYILGKVVKVFPDLAAGTVAD